MMIPRADLDRALGDFAALSQDVQVDQQPTGGFRLAAVRPGSFFERIGLRPNDVVLRVDGRAINGVDDASAAYAWLRVTSQFTVEILRAGRPLALRYVISQPMTASAQ
jgi:S1-C subfamily serine protease